MKKRGNGMRANASVQNICCPAPVIVTSNLRCRLSRKVHPTCKASTRKSSLPRRINSCSERAKIHVQVLGIGMRGPDCSLKSPLKIVPTAEAANKNLVAMARVNGPCDIPKVNPCAVGLY
jgi:hypothetical protein